ncbi:hypothetical protein HDV62DRAFT_170519 [Trichoderma sp. SZMC 28011]
MGPFIFAPLTRKERKREKSFSPILGFPCFLFSLLLLLLLLLFHSAPILSSCCLSRRIRSNTPDRRRLSRKPKLAAADFFWVSSRALFSLFSFYPYHPWARASTSPPPLGQSCTPSPYWTNRSVGTSTLMVSDHSRVSLNGCCVAEPVFVLVVSRAY